MYTRGGKREVLLQRVELEAENEKLPSGKTTTISQSVSASISPQLKHHHSDNDNEDCCPLQLIYSSSGTRYILNTVPHTALH